MKTKITKRHCYWQNFTCLTYGILGATATIGGGIAIAYAYTIDHRDWNIGVSINDLRIGDNISDMYLIPDKNYTYQYDASTRGAYTDFLECSNGFRIKFECQYPGYGGNGADVVSVFRYGASTEDFLCMARPSLPFAWDDEWDSIAPAIEISDGGLGYNDAFIINGLQQVDYRLDVRTFFDHVKIYKNLPWS